MAGDLLDMIFDLMGRELRQESVFQIFIPVKHLKQKRSQALFLL